MDIHDIYKNPLGKQKLEPLKKLENLKWYHYNIFSILNNVPFINRFDFLNNL